jgi:site-specific recombinase XerD
MSREEVFRILSSVANVKHKAILMLTYSAGLRVSEVVKLRVEDNDTQRKLIHIKGATEIYTHVSNKALGKIISPLDTMDFKEIKV